jgi:hypothetical protein
MNYIWDIETFPNCFQLCAICDETDERSFFEISSRRNDFAAMQRWLRMLQVGQHNMIGFNNVGFDYPVLHFILQTGGCSVEMIYEKAMAVIKSEDKFAHYIKPSDYMVNQIDLFKIHHFDNKARMTSLKALEFNMQLSNISDLPFPVGTMLTPMQMNILGEYCFNDVIATREFFHETKGKIAFRAELTEKHGQNFTNYNDTKIGAEIFRISLEAAGIPCYDFGPDGRTPRQTVRSSIRLADCIPNYIRFYTAEFNRIWEHLRNTTITETKGVFKDLTAKAFGLEWVFGTGGIHASVESEAFIANDQMMILDLDVTSMYPSIAISNGYYPEHLTPKFVEVYQQLKEQRVSYGKKTAENAMLKLALNGVYGKSNDKFSIFYDPKFTMSVTLTGQLCLAMLAERLAHFGKIIQANTDGITLYIPRTMLESIRSVYREWEKDVGLQLEENEYSKMHIADVNSYIAVPVKGDVKRKGRYEHDLEWHQDASCLVVPKVAEQIILNGGSIRETVENWPTFLDFMLRCKVSRGSKLVMERNGIDEQLENTQRYYVSRGGLPMTKIMPPLKKDPTKWRRIAVQKGFGVCPCNNILAANQEINYDWYINEVEKLILGVI